MGETWSREKILELSAAFLKPRILLTAAEMDLFAKLDGNSLTVEQLSRREGWDTRGLRILLDALSAMGLLTKGEGDVYCCDPLVAELLVGGKDDSILPMVLHRSSLWRSWSNLTEIVRTGRNPYLDPNEVRPPGDLEAFIGAMDVVGKPLAATIAASIDLTPFKRLLDIGGGPGTYTMAFLRAAPHMNATLFDMPVVVEMARKRFVERGFADRVKIAQGDYNVDALPAGHDLALASAVIHSNGRRENQVLFGKIFDALEPGGTVLIRDYLLDSSRTVPPDGAIFAVNMLAATEKGDCYTLDEVTSDLLDAGFTDVRLILDGKRMDQVLSAVKP